MIKKIFILLIFLSSTLFAFDLPDEFYVTERWVSFTRGFDIETPQFRLGTVFRKFWSLLPCYEFCEKEEKAIACAKMRFLTFGAVFDVVDCATEKLIGTVEEEVFTWYPTFRIYSATGEKLAVAEMNFWGTTYELMDPFSKTVFATLKRSFFRLKDDWKATITDRKLFDSKKIDPLLFITLMAFQTDADHWKSHHNSQLQVEASFCEEDDCPHDD